MSIEIISWRKGSWILTLVYNFIVIIHNVTSYLKLADVIIMFWFWTLLYWFTLNIFLLLEINYFNGILNFNHYKLSWILIWIIRFRLSSFVIESSSAYFPSLSLSEDNLLYWIILSYDSFNENSQTPYANIK